MKAYTNIEQSKKLAEILPTESADMCYLPTHIGDEHHFIASLSPYLVCTKMTDVSIEYCTPCWSLTALLRLMPFQIIENNNRFGFYQVKGFDKQGETYRFGYKTNNEFFLVETSWYNDPVDAAYEMIIKLHDLNLL